jgi:hypothetical protein
MATRPIVPRANGEGSLGVNTAGAEKYWGNVFTQKINDIPVEIGKNDCFFSFPNETHKIISNQEDPLRFVFLAFYAKTKTQGNTLINYITQTCQASNNRKYHIESLYPICSSILQELQNEDTYTERVLALLLEQILIKCSRKISKKNEQCTAIRADRRRNFNARYYHVYRQQHLQNEKFERFGRGVFL